MTDAVRLLLGDCFDALRAMPDASIDAVVTDPPYGISFMGKHWDRFDIERRVGQRDVSKLGVRLTGDAESANRKETVRTVSAFANAAGEAGDYDTSLRGNQRFQAWCEELGAELLRVLKPGGHALVFGGTRTYHRMAAGLEDAGFEIRDTLAWMFGSGFPKSLDVSKAIDARDAADERLARARRSQEWLCQHVTPQQVNEVTDSDMGHHLTTHPTQPFVPTPVMLDALRPLLPQVPDWLEELVRDRAVESENVKSREVVGERTTGRGTGRGSTAFIGDSENRDVTIAHTPEAARWQGWGTALKPAFEPVVVARKPLSGTVAANVLEHGTGALNIDGCRIGFVSAEDERESKEKNRHGDFGSGEVVGYHGWDSRAAGGNYDPPGRWPANVVLDEEAAALLDEQTGELGFSAGGSRGAGGQHGRLSPIGAQSDVKPGFAERGGASRFFYCAKVSRAERNAGLDGFPLGDAPGSKRSAAAEGRESALGAPRANHHPTVKPIDLMRWLIRLVTPPGGVVLDPFLGSGSTGCAAVLEGVGFVGCEREPDYMQIAEARIGFWREHGDDGLRIVRERDAAAAKREAIEAAGQLGLFGEGAAA